MSTDLKKSPSNGPLSAISSSSEFQILEHPTPVENGEMQPLLDLSHLHFDFDEATGTLTLEEAVTKVKDLMRENQQLKEILLENNSAIREYHDVLLHTQNKYETTHRELTVRGEQSRNVVNRLMKSLKEKDTRVNELEDKMKTMSNQNQDGPFVSEHVLEELQSTIDRLKEENMQLKSQRTDELQKEGKPQDLVSLQDELRTVNATIREWKNRAKRVEQEKENLVMSHEQDMAELEKNKQYAEQMENEVKEGKKEIEKHLGRIKELEECEKTMQEQLDALREEVNQKTEANMKILAEKKELLAQNMQLHAELGEYRSQSINGALYVEFNNEELEHGPPAQRPTAEGSSYDMVEAPDNRDSTRVRVDQSLDARMAREMHLGAPANSSQTEVKENVLVVRTPGSTQDERDKKALQEAQTTIEDLKKEIDQLAADLSAAKNKAEAYEAQIQQMKESHARETQVFKDQVEKSSKQDTQNLVSMVNEVQRERERADKATQELKQMKLMFNAREGQLATLQKDTEERRAQDDKIIDDVTNALSRTTAELEQVKRDSYHKAQECGALRQSLDQVYKDYTNLLNTFEQYKQECDTKNADTVSAAQYRDVLEQLDGLTAQLLAAGESIEMKEEELKNLKASVRKLRSENEAVPILNAQAEVYKNDFETEREARLREHEERVRLEQDVQQLQVQIQHLQEELEQNSQQQMMEMQRRHAAYQYPGQVYPQGPPRVRPTTPPQAQMYPISNLEGGFNASPQFQLPNPRQSPVPSVGRSSEEEEYFRCPKCMQDFPDFDSLNIHVMECLERDQ